MAFGDSVLRNRDDGRPWELPDGGRGVFVAGELYMGPGQYALEVVTASADKRPNASDVRNLWKRRHGSRPSPVLLVVLYPDKGKPRAAVCGPVGEDPPVLLDLEPGQVERVAVTALGEPDKHAAIRFLHSVLPEVEVELPGVRNVGMFANHELRSGVRERADWVLAGERAKELLSLRGPQLVRSLGYTIEPHSTTTSVLKAGGKKRAVAVFLEDKETPEGPSTRFSGLSPVSQALAVADGEGLPYVVVTRGSQIRIYAAGTDVGVGRKGRANTFIELHLALLTDENAAYLPLIFGAHALLPAGTFEQILEESKRFATNLGTRLRDRVYVELVPALATAVSQHYKIVGEEQESQLEFIYEEVLFILFRLLFIAYAEDKDLLPFRSNGVYRRHALKTLAQELAGHDGSAFDADATDMWLELKLLFKAIESGNTDWGVPQYDGGLFTADREVSEVGYEIDSLTLTNAEIGPALRALLVDRDESATLGPVDFRSLSVREFGTIYEGLLESSLSVAQVALTIDSDGHWVPAKEGVAVEAAEGSIYLHNRSGARKSSGSYFTKPFAVEHLLDHALEPALDKHIERLDALASAGDENDAAEAFFDFRCADIAMGSGHFLVAAVDRIEARLSGFLARQPLPRVIAELDRLRESALEALGELAEGVEIEHASLLRRQVARRCVYGVDLNPIAVELSRLALWIHTFVPGLPLSFLDHGLIHGDSLTGFGTLDEAVRVLEPNLQAGQASLYYDEILSQLDAASEALQRLALASEASMKEVKEARAAQQAARDLTEPVARLLDLLVAVQLGRAVRPLDISPHAVASHPDCEDAADLAAELQAVHFLVAFPEVFLRDRRGFDCLLGNPPWDKVRYEPQQFWVGRWPGLNSLAATARDNEIERLREAYPEEAALELRDQEERERLQELFGASYRFLGRGHYDFAKVFAERATDLLCSDGRLGYVLPRQSLVLGGWSAIRERLIAGHKVEAVQTRNKKGWLFEDVDHRFMVVLLSMGPADDDEGVGVRIWPSLTSLAELLLLQPSGSLWLNEKELESLSDAWVVPWFNGLADVPVFEAMRSGARLSGSGWATGIPESVWDFSGTGRHRSFVGRDQPGAWHVMMARHVDQFRLANEDSFQRHVPSPSKLVPLKLGVGRRDGDVVLTEHHPQLVFRYPSRNDDARTMIATALPSSGYLPSKGYVHTLRVSPNDPVVVLALLAYLDSYVCDWWVRRFVDRHITNPVASKLPLPNWSEDERNNASQLAATLLVRRGAVEMVGPTSLAPFAKADGTDEELLASIEHLVAQGFGLSKADVDAALSDFSDSGCPPKLRDRILKEAD